MLKIFGFVLSVFMAMGIYSMGIYYAVMPVFSLDYIGTVIAILTILYPVAILMNTEKTVITNIVFGLIFIVYLIGSFLSSTAIINADKYRNLLGKVESKDFKHSLPPIDIKNAPLVSEHMAIQLAQKKISDIQALGSQVELGAFVKQNIDGKLYWVSFLEHSGFFQWFNTGSTPGYIKVSASNPDDVQFITEVNGQKLSMKYLESAFFGNNARRTIYQNGNRTVGITDFSSEIDDEGNPYIVTTLFDKKIGVMGEDAIGVSILNVQTGDVKNYKLHEVPAWVDRIYPEELLKEQIADWGNFINGWFNPSHKGQLTLSSDLDLVYGVDGSCYFYTGITSIGKDNGIIGFLLINSRTKAVSYYTLSGANEDVAARTAVEFMPEKNYHSTNPLPFSVNGLPTYIMSLTDSNGIPRAYAMVDIQNYQIYAVSDTLKNTYQLYESKLTRNLGVNIDSKTQPKESLEGIVERISSEIKNNNTLYYLMISGNTKMFIATSDISEKIVLTKANDKVKINFNTSDNKIINLTTFENLTIK